MSNIALPRLGPPVVFNRTNPAGWKGWGRVRAAQVNELASVVRIAAWGQFLNALLLVSLMARSVGPVRLGLWVGALALLMLVAVGDLERLRARPVHTVSRKAVDRTAYYSLLFGLIWAMPATSFFPLASHPEQLAICIVTASLMAGAAFIFSPVPPAAAGFVTVTGAAVTNMLTYAGSPVVTLIGAIYTGGLLLTIYFGGIAFMKRRCVELALEERTETVSLLLRDYESSDADWLWQTNRKLDFQNVSPRFARAIGHSVDELEGLSILELLDRGRAASPGSAKALDGISRCLRERKPFTEQLVPITGSGGTLCIELTARPRCDSQGRFVGYHGVGSDVTEARAAADRIAHMARHDGLTGLPNRTQLMEVLGAALDRTKTGQGRCAVLLIDLDRFKSVNDSLGHVAGDHLLRQVSSRVAPLLGDAMLAGRLGGDEFAVAIEDAADRAEVARLACDLIEALKLPFVYHDQHLFVGASVGIAIGPEDGGSVEELIRNADLALYRAKAEGGNDICFYEPSLHASAEERRRIELALRSAADADEFNLVYQPVVDAASGEVGSFEALIRWTSRELGEVPPARFIDIAEETGLIGRIGEWVLRTACREASGWPERVSIAVNISPLQLGAPGFVDMLVSALADARLDPRRLELEITETVFLHITAATRAVLRRIQELGVRLAIDDFGTGYSSFGYLRDSAFDTIKIDRSFVQAMVPDAPESTAIIKAVVALAGNLGMATVAEGVETPEQLGAIRALGCDRVQGYVFSDPLPAAAARAFVGVAKAAGRSRAA